MKQLLLPIIAASILVGCGKKEPAIDIWTAAATGNITVIKQHISIGTDLDAKEPMNGSSPLIVAALYGHTQAMKLLVENGASLDIQNNQGSTALHTATFICHPEAVALLLEQGANPEIKNNFGRTALEAVSGEWTSEIEGRYTQIARALNLELDLKRIKAVRPQVAELIRRHNER
jgi:Ankyrin repeats (3 copies)